jgi:BlaI family transcriptional regulator, penicillinase repressor
MSDPSPTDGELAILRILWSRLEPMTVHEVHQALLRTKDTAYTTVLKMLTIMSEKGLVTRDESERRHRYAAVYSEPAVQDSLLKNFVQTAFAGSAARLVQQALGSDATSLEELDEIERMIAEARTRRAQ